jgi:hypothetical protein
MSCRALLLTLFLLLLDFAPTYAQAVAIVSTLNEAPLRRGAGDDYEMLVRVPAYAALTAVGRSADNVWVRVTFNGTSGWVSALLLYPADHLQSLPIESAVVAYPQFLARSTSDRPDDLSNDQIHVMYVLPSDGIDQSLDSSGAIAVSVSAMNQWFAAQSGGASLRLDTYQGSLDISFWQLEKTNAEIANTGAFVVQAIEAELQNAGLLHSNKRYGVYYGGSSFYACGGAAWTPALPGSVGALYLLGTPPDALPCTSRTLTTSPDVPGYWEFAMLHEIFHTLGAVAPCAPHHADSGHVTDSPTDLMYSGDEPWTPSVLDYHNDDYFGHENPDCPDFADSPYLALPIRP